VIEAEVENSAAIIRDFVQPFQDADGYKGNFSTSYAVRGHEESTKFVSSNRFSINAEDSARIAEILGDQYGDLIDEKNTVKLKDAVFENEALSTRLMELIGDEFAEFFETITTIGVKEDFNKLIYRTVTLPEKLTELRVYCRQYKASLR
jgi:hypothetical protein